MGRTKRKRKRRRKFQNSTHIFPQEIRNLTLSMRKFGWKNVSKLNLKDFGTFGRGLTSSKNLKAGETLIEAPIELLITFNTILQSGEFIEVLTGSMLKIQEILAIFLVVEKSKVESEWKFYLDTLPVEVKLPFLSIDDFKFFPQVLREKCEKSFEILLESCTRLKPIFQKLEIDMKQFLWGYTMVNTRAVFIDPKYFKNHDILLDEPNLALFPFMDMFNHADDAENSVEIRDNIFQLKTMRNQKKNMQIFISYGRHDNLKLFTEYGFFLPNNLNDKLKFKPENIIRILSLELNNFQYSFLKKHQFLNYEELFISSTGISFKLKGFLYVALNESLKNYDYIIFCGNFDRIFIENLGICAEKLIHSKISEYEDDLVRVQGCKCDNVYEFLKNRVRFAGNLSKNIGKLVNN